MSEKIPHSYMESSSIIQLPMLCKVLSRFNASTESEKKSQNTNVIYNQTSDSQRIFKQKDELGSILHAFQIYCQAELKHGFTMKAETQNQQQKIEALEVYPWM